MKMLLILKKQGQKILFCNSPQKNAKKRQEKQDQPIGW